ncbi:MAG: serine O-acetyltransferase [Nitrospirota bacterium]
MFNRLRDDIRAVFERDPAATSYLEVILTYAGLHALLCHRVSHWLWMRKMPFIPRFLSQLCRFFTGIEIHPGATIGRGFFIDHGMGVVIGETSEIGDNVTLFQGVTLGGTGKERGKRHPTIGNNVVIGTGAKILGAIRIGDHVRIGANSVVLQDVPPYSTVVGIPGRVVRIKDKKFDNLLMDHIHMPDPIAKRFEQMEKEIEEMRKIIKNKSRK